MCDDADRPALDAGERMLSEVISAMDDGEAAVRACAEGDYTDPEVLDRYVQALEKFRAGVVAGGVKPTEDDVRAVQRLADLVRAGAPREELVPCASRALHITEDPGASLDLLCMALPWLAGQAPGLLGFRHAPEPDEVRQHLDAAVSFVERGGGAGFTPLPDDVDRVRRLRELIEIDGPERRRLASELWARMPEKVREGMRALIELSRQPPGCANDGEHR